MDNLSVTSNVVISKTIPGNIAHLVVLGCGAFPASRGIHRAVDTAAIFSAVVGSVTIIGFVTDLNVDGVLLRGKRVLGTVPVARMALVTACCFVLVGVSLWLARRQARSRAAIFGILVALAGTVCLTYGDGCQFAGDAAASPCGGAP